MTIWKTIRCPRCGQDDDIPHDDEPDDYKCFCCGTTMQSFTSKFLPEFRWQ